MLRMNRLRNNVIEETTKKKMYSKIEKCLIRLHEAKRDNEGRIQCFGSSVKVFVTGKKELVEEYGKFMYNKILKSGYRITKDASESYNTYEMIVFNLFDCDFEQREIIEDYLDKFRGVSFVLLPFINYSDSTMANFGDGFYLQLGEKPLVKNDKAY